MSPREEFVVVKNEEFRNDKESINVSTVQEEETSRCE